MGLDRGFLMPRQQLETIARALPKNAEELGALLDMRRWQVEALGETLLEAVRRQS
jgi:ribonuclease D